mmetsp:Transcript_38488/g.110510  ORF Transcript_38488/g.110510 Transcript_38488/m.110510 type:complete len:258 (-) Transcript_38488:430-1203(-)
MVHDPCATVQVGEGGVATRVQRERVEVPIIDVDRHPLGDQVRNHDAQRGVVGMRKLRRKARSAQATEALKLPLPLSHHLTQQIRRHRPKVASSVGREDIAPHRVLVLGALIVAVVVGMLGVAHRRAAMVEAAPEVPHRRPGLQLCQNRAGSQVHVVVVAQKPLDEREVVEGPLQHREGLDIHGTVRLRHVQRDNILFQCHLLLIRSCLADEEAQCRGARRKQLRPCLADALPQREGPTAAHAAEEKGGRGVFNARNP